MKKLHVLPVILSLFALSSCYPKITTNLMKHYPPLDYNKEVVVISLDQVEPENSEMLGSVKIGDTGFSTKCGYNLVIEKAKLEARKAGGNAIKITEHKPPTALGSTCHRITAKILKVENIDNYLPSEDDEIISDADYAVLNVYRISGLGPLVSYDLYLGDSVICRVKNNFKTTLHIKKDGLNTLWSKTEAKSEVPIDVIHGKTYYLRCSVTMGVFVGHPKLELVDRKTGKSEFELLNAKNK